MGGVVFLISRCSQCPSDFATLYKRLEKLKLNSELQSSTNGLTSSHYGSIIESRIAHIRDSTLSGSLFVTMDIK